jgi:hypothetical protein
MELETDNLDRYFGNSVCRKATHTDTNMYHTIYQHVRVHITTLVSKVRTVRITGFLGISKVRTVCG